MKAAVVPAVGATWRVEDVPVPRPGPNQILIQIRASGLCYTDVHLTNGSIPSKFPRTLGHEPVGEIVEVGEGVRTRKVGDRVGVPWLQAACGRCEWCLRGKALFCPDQTGTGMQTHGSHAEYMLAYADSTMPLPDGLSYEQAAPIFCAGYTVWSGLRLADPKHHDRVAVLGVGGLGHLTIQYSKAAGFETIAISHSADKERLARELGADEVVRDGSGLLRAGGADVLLHTSNSYEGLSEIIEALRPDGRLVLMGASEDPLILPSLPLILKRLRVLGSQQNGTEYLYEALDLVAKGKVKVMTETYPLDEIGKAYERVAAGKVRFRAVITT